MGGPKSPAKSGLVYRGHERRHNRSGRRAWRRLGIAYLHGRARLSDLIRTVRIADDDFTATTILCPHCAAKHGSVVYPAPLVHSAEEIGTLLKVIDIAIEIRGWEFRITRLNKNVDFIMGATTQARTRFLPPAPPPCGPTYNMMRGWIAGSLALDARRNGATEHRYGQALLTVFELLRLGHNPLAVSRALRGVRHPQLRDVSLHAAKVMLVLHRMKPRQDQLPQMCLDLMQPWIQASQSIGMVPMAF